MIDTPEGIRNFQKMRCYYALKLEVRTGLRHSRGSVMNLILTNYMPECKKRTKKGVLAEFRTKLVNEGILSGQDKE
jgi:hypothetical protein